MPAAAAQSTPTTDVDLSQDFSAVFDSLMNEGEAANDSPNNDAPPPAATGAGDAPDPAQQPDQSPDGAGDSGQPAQPGADAPAPDGQGEPAGTSPDPAGGDTGGESALAAQLAALQAEIAALKSAQPAPTPAPAPAAAPEPEIYTPEEQTELAEIKKEWPDIYRMVQLMTRQTEVNVVKYTFGELGKVLTPLQQSVNTITGNEHLDAIYSAHADYDAVYQPTMDWIEQQPGFLKTAYQNVVKQGTAEEVSLMIQRFKDETGWKSPAAGVGGSRPAAPVAPAPAQPAELSDAAKKAAKAIGAVGTKRGAIPASQDPSDFDGAWVEATASK